MTIFALTDSHQETRNLAALLSGICNMQKHDSEFLLFDSGDLFKGVYDKELSVKTYLKFKDLRPNANIFITLGNNDFGFDNESFEYLKNVLTEFKNAGIECVCANLKNSDDNTYSNLISRYKIISIDNKKILITGFCLPTGVVKQFGLYFEDYRSAFKDLINSVNEHYNHIIVLNHHWQRYSVDLYEFAKQIGYPVSLIIGGHEHSPVKPDYERNIFYPRAFGLSVYKIELNDKIEKAEDLPVNQFDIISELEAPIKKYEKDTELFKPITKRVLNLWKRYSNPCPLGTFISDNMKEIAKTDIAFHSTGMTMFHLKYEENGTITNYDFKRTICAPNKIVKMTIDINQLKKIFENATKNRMSIDNGNSRFLQCSHNIEITGKENYKEKTYKIIQISIDGKNLLDENFEPIDKNIKFTAAVDEFIAKGSQGFDVLKEIPYSVVKYKGEELRIDQLLYNSLIKAAGIYMTDTQYPPFILNDL